MGDYYSHKVSQKTIVSGHENGSRQRLKRVKSNNNANLTDVPACKNKTGQDVEDCKSYIAVEIEGIKISEAKDINII